MLISDFLDLLHLSKMIQVHLVQPVEKNKQIENLHMQNPILAVDIIKTLPIRPGGGKVPSSSPEGNQILPVCIQCYYLVIFCAFSKVSSSFFKQSIKLLLMCTSAINKVAVHI